MHDILEGVWENDFGLILHQFVLIDKFFTLNDLEKRINELNYGDNENRNKPREISMSQIKKKYVKMSASEAHTCIR